MENNLPYMTKKVIVEEATWEYVVSGSGRKTVLIFPGGGQNAQSNWRLIEELESKYKVIAVTIYDCSSIHEFVAAVNKILQIEHVNDKVAVYGLSLGALMAQSYTRRNEKLVDSLIISHGCTPQSKTYKRKVIVPLMVSRYVLPIVPNHFLKYMVKISGRIQGSHSAKSALWNVNLDDKTLRVNRLAYEYFLERNWNKTIIKTWINLHLDFYKNEKFDEDTFRSWDGKTLILRTDNDPLMQDEGWFKKIYPTAIVHTFKETGHLTFFYQFEQMIHLIKDFLK